MNPLEQRMQEYVGGTIEISDHGPATYWANIKAITFENVGTTNLKLKTTFNWVAEQKAACPTGGCGCGPNKNPWEQNTELKEYEFSPLEMPISCMRDDFIIFSKPTGESITFRKAGKTERHARTIGFDLTSLRSTEP